MAPCLILGAISVVVLVADEWIQTLVEEAARIIYLLSGAPGYVRPDVQRRHTER